MNNMSDIALRIENASFSFASNGNPVGVLQNIMLQANKNETLVIFGKHRGEASILLHTIGGLIRPTSGNIYYGDENICPLDELQLSTFRRRQIGTVNMPNSYLSDYSIKTNMMFPFLNDKTYADEAHLEAIACAFGIHRFLNSLPTDLTFEQQQRCSLACAVAKNPGVILYDEQPELTRFASEEMLALLRLAQREYGQTIIIATSNTHTAASGDRVIRVI